MKLEITPREKKMLLILGTLLALVICVQFVIRPLLGTISERRDELSKLDFERTRVELLLASEPNLRSNLEKSKLSYAQQLTIYPQKLSNEEIDNILTGLSRQSALQATLLAIGDAQQPELEALQKDMGIPPVEEAVLPELSEEGEEKTPPSPERSVFFLSSSTMGHRGDYQAVQGMLGNIDRLPKLRTVRLTLRPAEERGRVGQGQQLISFGIELAMLEPHVALQQDPGAQLPNVLQMPE